MRHASYNQTSAWSGSPRPKLNGSVIAGTNYALNIGTERANEFCALAEIFAEKPCSAIYPYMRGRNANPTISKDLD